jgi:hypothetical protein
MNGTIKTTRMKEYGLTEKRYIALLSVITISIMGIILTKNKNPLTPASSSSNTTTTTRFALAALLSVEGSREWWNQQKYIASAEKLALSFRRYSNLDMVLLVVDQYGIVALRKADEARLARGGWTVHRISTTIPEEENNNNRGWDGTTTTKLFSKLWMWRLSMYELILYTDLDTLFVESPEVLFRLRPSPQNPGMVLDTGRAPHYFNTGVILLHPSEDMFQRLVKAIIIMNHHRTRQEGEEDTTEQYFLNHYFHGQIIKLDARFNRQVCAQDNCLNDDDMAILDTREKSLAVLLKDTATIIHFNGDNNKPWNLKNCVQQNIVQLCMFWKHYHG